MIYCSTPIIRLTTTTARKDLRLHPKQLAVGFPNNKTTLC